MTDPAEVFFSFAERAGLSLSRLAPNSKLPLGNPWADYSGTRGDWRQWLIDGNNFALPMGPNRLLAVDIDAKLGKPSGLAPWHEWCAAHQISFEPAWITPSGGAHVLFRLPGDFDGQSLRQPRLADGVDIRASYRSYLACPPSKLETGRYLILPNATIHAAPVALLEHVTRPPATNDKAGGVAAGEVDVEDAKSLVTYLSKHSEFESYDEWLSCGMALKASCGDAGRAAWQLAHNSTVTADVEQTKWESFSEQVRPGDVTIASMIAKARSLGWAGSVRRRADAIFANIPVPPAGAVSMLSTPGWTPPAATAPEWSEIEIAERFVDSHANRICHVKAWGKWLYWTDNRWHRDDSDFVLDLARKHCRQEAIYCASRPGGGNPRTLCSDSTVRAVCRLAQVDRRVSSTVERWDADAFVIGTPSGVIDLKSGQHRAARPEDYVTKSTSIEPGGDCPAWRAFLRTATGGDTELEQYLHRLCGYALTGSVREHSLHFAYGPGGSGKGTFSNTIAHILADYSVATSIETFTASNYDRHPTELAALQGARLVVCNETERGRHWAESRIKELTGGDTISARFMRQDFFTFKPTFKIFISGNYRPHMRPDAAMRRRFQLVPFNAQIPRDQIDHDLSNKLEREAGGILAWMVEGCVAWQREGLKPPPAVVEASEEYFADEAEDAIAMWLRDCCETDEGAEAPHGVLYRSFKFYAEQAGERPGSSKAFGKELRSKKFESRRTSQGVLVSGLTLRTPCPPPMPVREAA